jgi:hypothetical protein
MRGCKRKRCIARFLTLQMPLAVTESERRLHAWVGIWYREIRGFAGIQVGWVAHSLPIPANFGTGLRW